MFSMLFVINRIKDIQNIFFFLTCGYRWNRSQNMFMLTFMYAIWRPLYPTPWTCFVESKTVFGGPTTNPQRKRKRKCYFKHVLMKVKLNLGVQPLIPHANFRLLQIALWPYFAERFLGLVIVLIAKYIQVFNIFWDQIYFELKKKLRVNPGFKWLM